MTYTEILVEKTIWYIYALDIQYAVSPATKVNQHFRIPAFFLTYKFSMCGECAHEEYSALCAPYLLSRLPQPKGSFPSLHLFSPL